VGDVEGEKAQIGSPIASLGYVENGVEYTKLFYHDLDGQIYQSARSNVSRKWDVAPVPGAVMRVNSSIAASALYQNEGEYKGQYVRRPALRRRHLADLVDR
jgi:hypothetical protein